jgi:[ribosomal protein S5]-alanine N-acetyltransferase
MTEEKNKIKIISKNLTFRILTLDNVSQKYIKWLNDPDVIRYLETRFIKQDLNECKSFVSKMYEDSNNYLFGIFYNINNEHIGNIKIGFINQNHQKGQISLFIGEKDYWNKGYATESIQAITKWGFNSLGLKKIEAGCYEQNLSSLRSFLKI